MKKIDIVQDGYMITASGIMFNLMNPKKFQIKIEDIAHGLSNICRWNGHTQKFYSVAEHSIRCVTQFLSMVKGNSEISVLKTKEPTAFDNYIWQNSLALLLHDSEEAYWGDIISPLKKVYPEINGKMIALREMILRKYGASDFNKETVKIIDLRLLTWEYENLIKSNKKRPWSPMKAKEKYLEWYFDINKEYHKLICEPK